MVNYLQVLQNQFEYGFWLDIALEDGDHGNPDGFTSPAKLTRLLMDGTVAQAMRDSVNWNRQQCPHHGAF